MNAIVNTDRPTFLVEFMYQSVGGRFICQGVGLVECLTRYDKNGVKSIKMFDPSKGTFKRVAKKDILQFFTWETEAYLYLTNHYYFK